MRLAPLVVGVLLLMCVAVRGHDASEAVISHVTTLQRSAEDRLINFHDRLALQVVSQQCQDAVNNATAVLVSPQCQLVFTNFTNVFADPSSQEARDEQFYQQYCDSDCVGRLVDAYQLLLESCDQLTDADAATVESSLLQIQRSIELPCLRGDDDEFCLPVFLNTTRRATAYFRDNQTVAIDDLTEGCDSCVPRMLEYFALYNGAQFQTEDIAYASVVCLQDDQGRYCAEGYQETRSEAVQIVDNLNQDVQNSDEDSYRSDEVRLHQILCEDECFSRLHIAIVASLRRANLASQADQYDQEISGVPEGVEIDCLHGNLRAVCSILGINEWQRLNESCDGFLVQGDAATCSDVCRNAFLNMSDDLGCCAPYYVKGFLPNEQTAIEAYVSDVCNVSFPSICPEVVQVWLNVTIRNLSPDYYQQNKDTIDQNLIADVAVLAGIDPSKVQLVNFTQTTVDGDAAIEYLFVLETYNNEELQGDIESELQRRIDQDRLAMASLALLPTEARANPSRPVDVVGDRSDATRRGTADDIPGPNPGAGDDDDDDDDDDGSPAHNVEANAVLLGLLASLALFFRS